MAMIVMFRQRRNGSHAIAQAAKRPEDLRAQITKHNRVGVSSRSRRLIISGVWVPDLIWHQPSLNSEAFFAQRHRRQVAKTGANLPGIERW